MLQFHKGQTYRKSSVFQYEPKLIPSFFETDCKNNVRFLHKVETGVKAVKAKGGEESGGRRRGWVGEGGGESVRADNRWG
jgi:hypothetical protein